MPVYVIHCMCVACVLCAVCSYIRTYTCVVTMCMYVCAVYMNVIGCIEVNIIYDILCYMICMYIILCMCYIHVIIFSARSIRFMISVNVTQYKCANVGVS